MIREDELLENTKIPSIKLRGDDASAYFSRLFLILRAARLNLFFPDVRRITDHLRVMAPETHGGLYDGIDVDRRSGLPSYKEWIRAQTDVRLAPSTLSGLGDRAALERRARAEPDSIHEKQFKKHAYYDRIKSSRLAELGGMQVSLRRVDHAEKTAYFHVVFDKFEASGLFVRYSIDLGQRASVWGENVVDIEGETSAQTAQFQSLIYKMASLDAELTFLKLSELSGLSVERVVKGVIGPIHVAGVTDVPPVLGPLMTESSAFVGTFFHSLVAMDVAEDKDNDPFAELSAEEMTNVGDRRALRAKFGYHVFRDRKFVVPKANVSLMRSVCDRANARSIVYGA